MLSSHKLRRQPSHSQTGKTCMNQTILLATKFATSWIDRREAIKWAIRSTDQLFLCGRILFKKRKHKVRNSLRALHIQGMTCKKLRSRRRNRGEEHRREAGGSRWRSAQEGRAAMAIMILRPTRSKTTKTF